MFLIPLGIILICISVYLFAANAEAGKDSPARYLAFMFCLFLGGISVIMGVILTEKQGYERGRIDQATGKNSIQLVQKTVEEWQPATKVVQ